MQIYRIKHYGEIVHTNILLRLREIPAGKCMIVESQP